MDGVSVERATTKTINRYVVISDLHLGHMLRSAGDRLSASKPLPFSRLRTVVGLDRALAAFIDDLMDVNDDPLDGSALVLNGDIFDFLHVDIRPETGTFINPPLDGSEEELYGLSFEISRSRWKLGVIARLHRRAFRAFARFIERGGQLIFVVGNHDVDLCFEVLQDDLRGYILDHLAADLNRADSIVIEPWFHLTNTVVYLEHGHRFDPYTTFPDPLEPTSMLSDKQLAPNFAHYGLRYFANRIPTFPIYDLEHQPWVKIYGWIRKHPLIESWRALKAAFYFFFQYWVAMLTERKQRTENQGVHRFERRAKLLEIANQYGWSLKRIQKLDAMRETPVGHSPSRFIQALQLDRIFLIIGLVVFWIAMAASGSHTWLSLSLVLTLLIAALWWWLDQSRPQADLHPQLGAIAQRIGTIARVPIVIFGHTHQATCESHGRVIWLNPGSWEHLAHLGGTSNNEQTVHYGEVRITNKAISASLHWYSASRRAHGLVRTRRATFRDVP